MFKHLLVLSLALGAAACSKGEDAATAAGKAASSAASAGAAAASKAMQQAGKTATSAAAAAGDVANAAQAAASAAASVVASAPGSVADAVAAAVASAPGSVADAVAAAVADGPEGEANTLFVQRCVTCHGTEGKGDGPAAQALNPKPRSFGDADWQKSVTDEHLAKVIIEGGMAVGKSALMPANADLAAADKKPVVDALVKKVRAYAP